MGLINPVKGMTFIGSFMAEGLKYATVAGINEVGAKLNLDPNITSILSMTAGALVGGMWQGKLGQTLVNIAPNLASEFAFYGVTKLGNLLGLDPRISYLAGIGIRSSLQVGFSAGGGDPGRIWDGVINGLVRGATNIGLQWAYEELDIDPLLGSLAAAALTGAIEGFLEDKNALRGAYNTLFKAGTGLLTLGGYGNDPWSQAVYISQVLDFSQIIQERGIVDALETYATGFLHQTAIDSIWKMGGIYDLVTNNAEVVVNEEGETVKRVYINEGRTDFIDLTLDMDNMVGYKQGNILVDCPVVIGPDGRATTPNGKIKLLLDEQSRIVYYVEDWDVKKIEFIDSNGNLVAYILPIDNNTPIEINDDMSVRTGRLYNVEKNFIIDKIDGNTVRALFTPRSDLTDEQIQKLINEGIMPGQLDGVIVEYDKNKSQIRVEIDPNKIDPSEFEGKTSYIKMISANGVSNEFGEYTPPTYEQRLKYRLAEQGLDANTIFLLPMFEGGNTARDIAMWLLDNAGVNVLTNELIAKLDNEIYSDIMPGQQYEAKVALLYSGSTNSFIKAINRRHDYIIRDAIFLGGPTLDGIFEDAVITNPNMNRVFNVWGTKDMFLPLISNKKFSGNVDEFNIEILGATHFDYFYDPTRGALNARASYFVEKLLERIYLNADVSDLLSGPGVTYNDQTKKYTVDPFAINYDPGLEWRNGE
jgi:hypothetical protein